MEHPAGEADDSFLRVGFDRRLRLEFHDTRSTSAAALLSAPPYSPACPSYPPPARLPWPPRSGISPAGIWQCIVRAAGCCTRCRWMNPIQRVGGAKLLGDVVPRLRCQGCGTAPTWVKLVDGIERTARRVRSVMLVE
jgi:hypothetical protein